MHSSFFHVALMLEMYSAPHDSSFFVVVMQHIYSYWKGTFLDSIVYSSPVYSRNCGYDADHEFETLGLRVTQGKVLCVAVLLFYEGVRTVQSSIGLGKNVRSLMVCSSLQKFVRIGYRFYRVNAPSAFAKSQVYTIAREVGLEQVYKMRHSGQCNLASEGAGGTILGPFLHCQGFSCFHPFILQFSYVQYHNQFCNSQLKNWIFIASVASYDGSL